MAAPEPVIELADAQAAPGDRAPSFPVTLRLMPGELALVDARDPRIAAWFADLCCGLVPAVGGTVRFLGHVWTALPHDYAAALRGRIGRIFARGGWVGFLDTEANILLPQLHHGREARDALRERASRLACAFGLPGLPLDHPDDLPPIDLARAACVRAFLGEPALLLLENPVQAQTASLAEPLLNALATARQDGAAAIWLTRSDAVWSDRSFPAAVRLRLGERGLLPVRTAA